MQYAVCSLGTVWNCEYDCSTNAKRLAACDQTSLCSLSFSCIDHMMIFFPRLPTLPASGCMLHETPHIPVHPSRWVFLTTGCPSYACVKRETSLLVKSGLIETRTEPHCNKATRTSPHRTALAKPTQPCDTIRACVPTGTGTCCFCLLRRLFSNDKSIYLRDVYRYLVRGLAALACLSVSVVLIVGTRYDMK